MNGKSGTLFVHQSGPFAAIHANDNGYIYGQIPSGPPYEPYPARHWVRLDRPCRGREWQERRLIGELLDDL